MAAINWKNPDNGDWNVATDWSTGTVPGGSDDVTISAAGPYIVTVGSARTISIGPLHFPSFPTANSLTFNASQAGLLENTGSLTLTGALTVDSGFVSLNEANSIGSVALTGGVLAFGNGGALGAGKVTLSGGELLGTANETLTNALSFSGSSTIAAAHGTTLNENASSLSVAASSTLNFGALGEDGTILWHTSASSTFNSPLPVIDVQAGTLKGADGSFGFFLDDEAVTVAAGATLDLAGNGTTLTNLSGAGAVIDSGGADTLTLDAANFSGAISGALSLVAAGAVTLSGGNTYTGTTTIDSGDSLQIGAGAAGSIGAGAISDAGTLSIDASNAITLASPISGAGALKQFGTGVTSINTANTYTGGTTLSAGTLAIGKAGALGTGALAFTNGELLGTATETFANAINLSTSGSTTTFAAATGTTLDVTGAITFAGNNFVDIGAPGQDGEVLWGASPNGSPTGDTFDVLDGTLTAANSNLGTTLNFIAGTTVAAGATLDWAGNLAEIDNLQGAGTVTNSGAAQTMALLGTANFSGTISGALSPFFEGNASLSGLEDCSGGATLEGSATVANAGTYDIISNNGISGTPGSTFINDGLFEKTGGGGVSEVTTNFINSGTLDVLSGSIQFSGGFTNAGVIHGLVTQSGGVTTVSAPVPSDFYGDGLSDILLQNADGQAAIWDMNGANIVGGGAVSLNAGSSWTAIGTGDFYGDGVSDILFQNTNGQAAIWEMDGTNVVGGGPVGPNPGASWKAIGTGDFNGDGLADILWQNANGQVAVWELDGASQIPGGSQVLPVNPGPGWQAIGTGDFNDDGHSDILFQNTSSGQVAIWEMNGTNLIGGGVLSLNAGPGWQAVGTGDFYGDGRSDILFQNTSSGQVAIWEMDGTNVVGGGALSVNAGPGWKAVGTGDFTGAGDSDILLQNASGQAAIWEMNGTSVIGGGAVSANPGSSWHVIKAG
jgi:autotransporter-associated beta strand protein